MHTVFKYSSSSYSESEKQGPEKNQENSPIQSFAEKFYKVFHISIQK